MDEARRTELRRWAQAIADESDSAEARAAARAVDLLLDDVERLEGELETARRADGQPAKRKRPRGKGTVVGVLLVALLASIAVFGPHALAPDLAAAGPGRGDLIGAVEAKRLVFAVAGDPGAIADARWRVDGTDVTGRARIAGGRTELWGSYLADGEHEVEVVVPRSFPRFGASHSWRVAIDRTPPRIAVDPATARTPRDTAFTLRGTVEQDTAVTLKGRAAEVDGNVFAIPLSAPPAGPIELVATDAYGNRTWKTVRIAVVPRRPPAPLRAVHVTFYAWADRGLRRGVMRLIERGASTRSSSTSRTSPASSAGTRTSRSQAASGRFGTSTTCRRRWRCSTARASAWSAGSSPSGTRCTRPRRGSEGWKDQVIQTPAGGPYSGYGGFTNFADPAVRRYNIDIARRGGGGRRGRDPLRLRPPARRADLVDGLPRPHAARPSMRSRRSSLTRGGS